MSTAPGAELQGTILFEGRPLFDDIELALVPGGWTCLLGPSGVGKSSILRVFAGLDTGGSFRGRVTAADGLPVAGRVAFMAQTDLLAPWASVRRNVTLGARLRGERPDAKRAERLIARVGLAQAAEKRPAELSGGMRQRAALARTLMEDRPFVLLDEPFSALDAATRAGMQELAHELLAGRTKLLITHDPAEAARLGDRIHLLSHGGLSAPVTLPSPPIRAPDAPEVLEAQARLLSEMRSAA
ncbi:MAG TPA: ABC transporter ATP-binding protein [Thermohalobaculum sp.]|nr:ABC transporter ATP-binding protein [Thermohalobaculum sp.]